MGCNNFFSRSFPTVNTDTCPDRLGCHQGQCPDFVIRRHDTKPPFKVHVEDCDGPMHFHDKVVEFSMWARARLKSTKTTR